MISYYLLLLLPFSGIVASQVVTNLPGFDGHLPFKLETGYIGVGESNESQLFYYFVESRRNPALDPLMLWLSGGPGCSAFSAFFFENGPVSFKYENYSGGLPSLHLNPFAWTKGLNIIYLDQPVGTGFSYSTTQQNYYSDDLKSAWETYQFLQKWLIEHPQYLTNQLYIGGDSYAGTPIPIILQHILDGNEAGEQLFLNLKGYVLGNPKTDNFIDSNSHFIQAHRLALVPDGLYKFAKQSCNGDYVNINKSNTACVSAINAFNELILEINPLSALEPFCKTASQRQQTKYKAGRYLQEESYTEDVLILPLTSAHWCRDYNHILSDIWANNKTVREALHVRENTKGVWTRCNISGLAYDQSVASVIDYHTNLTKTSLRALIYSGDHDMSVPHIGTLNWIHLLNLTTDEYWRPWFVDGQVAGYTEKSIHNDYTLVYATVKGAGHVAPEYKPKECHEMVDRFFAYYPL